MRLLALLLCLPVLTARAQTAPPPEPPPVTVPAAVTPIRLAWERQPLSVVLPVGQERQVRFPGSVRVGVPVEINTLLRTQSLNGIVYWQAAKAFPRTRVQVFEETTGTIYLLDLSAEDKASATPVEVYNLALEAIGLAPGSTLAAGRATPLRATPLPGQRRAPGTETAAAATPTPTPVPASPPIDAVALVRYAAQQVFGPQRLIEPLPGISRASVPRQRFDTLIGGTRVIATPIAAWQGGGLHVTAVRLENPGSERVVLDPRRVRGAWLAAAFQHATLLPAYRGRDASTALYLVSRRPWAEALRGQE